jgi:hypothetical protein
MTGRRYGFGFITPTPIARRRRSAPRGLLLAGRGALPAAATGAATVGLSATAGAAAEDCVELVVVDALELLGRGLRGRSLLGRLHGVAPETSNRHAAQLS